MKTMLVTHNRARPLLDMLWLALRFPDLPLEALNLSHTSDQAYVVEDKYRVCACTQTAKNFGVQVGMKTSATHAFGEIVVLERAQQSEEKLLQNIANWAYAFTPYIKRGAENCLLLEISQCLRLFGGVESFCKKLRDSLDTKSLLYRVGLAHSESGARLLSYADYPVCDQDSQAVFMSRIKSMRLSTLEEFSDITAQLGNMGIGSIGEILQLPSPELGKRFGQTFVHWLNELEGKATIARSQHGEEIGFQESMTFAYAVEDVQQLQIPVTQLLQKLVNFLIKHQLEARQIDWQLYSPQGQVHSFNICLERIHGQIELLLELTQIKLDQIQLLFSIERVELCCDYLSPVNMESHTLFDNEVHAQRNIQQEAEEFVARMQTHLGKKAVYQLAPKPEYLPEKQSVKVLPFQRKKFDTTEQEEDALLQAPRPAWLFKRPQRIQHKNKKLHLAAPGTKPGYLHLVQGPERIEDKWWVPGSSNTAGVSNTNRVRDYFIAEHDNHVRYWIYHNWQNDRWYAHGVFA